jgi:hypothetical protein
MASRRGTAALTRSIQGSAARARRAARIPRRGSGCSIPKVRRGAPSARGCFRTRSAQGSGAREDPKRLPDTRARSREAPRRAPPPGGAAPPGRASSSGTLWIPSPMDESRPGWSRSGTRVARDTYNCLLFST